MVGDRPFIEQPMARKPAPGGPSQPGLVERPDAMLPPDTPDGVYRTPTAGPYDDLNSPEERNNKSSAT
jgi:hypothetical protein